MASKIATLHQPNYLPWLGFFSKIAQTDCYIMTDIHSYTRHSVTNRNKIRTISGWQYLTVPVDRRFHGSRICDVGLPPDAHWREDHWKAIYTNYGRTPFFDLYRDFFEELYMGVGRSFSEFNATIILYLLNCFDIKTKILKASEMDIDPLLLKTDLKIELLKQAGADTYLSGPSGKQYLELEKFPENGIELKFFEFKHPVYPQKYPGFEPAMSAIDLLFNTGPEAGKILQAAGEIVPPGDKYESAVHN